LKERPTLSSKAKSISKFGCFHFTQREIASLQRKREDWMRRNQSFGFKDDLPFKQNVSNLFQREKRKSKGKGEVGKGMREL
jgi:hypothetical protein